MFPSMSFTIVSFPAHDMSVILFAIFAIVKLFVLFPVPSCPALFLPHVYTSPSFVNANTWFAPAEILKIE